MTQPANITRPAIETGGPRSGSLGARASLAFKILAALGVFGVVLAMLPGTVTVSTLLAVTVNGAGTALAAVYVAEAIGLDRRRPWAVAAARPCSSSLPRQASTWPWSRGARAGSGAPGDGQRAWIVNPGPEPGLKNGSPMISLAPLLRYRIQI